MAAASIDWYRIPVDKETLRTFTQKSNLKGWLQAGSFLLIFLATTGLALYFFLRHWWVPMIAACYLHSLFEQMIGMSAAVHELSHGTPFKSKRVNEAFYHLFCFLTWNNPVHFRASHMLHHQFTAYRGLDKEVILEPVRVLMNWKNYIAWFTFDYTWFWALVKTTVLHAFGNADADFFAWDPLFEKGDPRRTLDGPLGTVHAHLGRRADCRFRRLPPLGAHLPRRVRRLLRHGDREVHRLHPAPGNEPRTRRTGAWWPTRSNATRWCGSSTGT